MALHLASPSVWSVLALIPLLPHSEHSACDCSSAPQHNWLPKASPEPSNQSAVNSDPERVWPGSVGPPLPISDTLVQSELLEMSGHQRTYYRKDLVLFQRGGSHGWHGYHYHVTKMGLLATPQWSQLAAKVTFLIPQPMVVTTVSSSINSSS